MRASARRRWSRCALAHAYSVPRTPRRWRTSTTTVTPAWSSAEMKLSPLKRYTPIVAIRGIDGYVAGCEPRRERFQDEERDMTVVATAPETAQRTVDDWLAAFNAA